LILIIDVDDGMFDQITIQQEKRN